MKDLLSKFILNQRFPCLMAKKVIRDGNLTLIEINDLSHPESIEYTLNQIYQVVDRYRKDPLSLRSFVLTCKKSQYQNFNHFEQSFWQFLEALHSLDKQIYQHDKRVSSNPESQHFSYSLKEEAFFILALHPESPRFSRRFSTPSLVFNIHQQFELLRAKGAFTKIRNAIRKRDKSLQGSINPMLKDFGERSEVFQYLGKTYQESDPCPLNLRN
jgi:FPC/CPF motif-containing protein YcgG